MRPALSSPPSPDPRMPLFYHDLYTDGVHPAARFPRERYRLLAERLRAAPYDELLRVEEAPLATREELLLAHDPTYVDRFLGGELSEQEARRIGLRPWTPLLIPRTLRIMGAALEALRRVARHGGVAANMAGGTHHAHRDWGSGFCVFNDIALCARLAPSLGFRRGAVIDLDVHQGDGTATLLESDEGVLTISVHCHHNFPFRKAKSHLDLTLSRGAGDVEYIATLYEALDAARAHAPDLVLYQAGVDPLASDALGLLALTHHGLAERDRLVFELCAELRAPCVVFMGGGYSAPISESVEAFVALFEEAARAHRRWGEARP